MTKTERPSDVEPAVFDSIFPWKAWSLRDPPRARSAARWMMILRFRGARVVGIDLSERQLDHASRAVRATRTRAQLVHGDAESLPFVKESFDTVFCDHGAIGFAPLDRVISEAGRVLRVGGLLAFCMSTPIRDICWDAESDRIGTDLELDYFGLHELEDEGSEATVYQLRYGEWIRLFRENGFEIEALVELEAPEGAKTTYAEYVPVEWARRWPAENIWKVRKARMEESR